MIESRAVRLRPLGIEDVEAFYLWACDREVTQFSLSSYAYPKSKADILSWLTTINDSSKTVSFGVCCNESDKLIGYAGISSISSLNRSGEYFILIGDKAYWGKGIGTEVTKVVTDYGFNSLGLHRIELTAFSVNPAAIRAYEKAGYQHGGVKRQSGFRNGEFFDKVQMSVLSNEWSGI
ncbi:GNAT family N-acetyltransferase [Vibrio sp. SCSIO 43140]|uniref:GNAT family N-acetyltransferase n=1 Tax=Vibrio sp. SCSIO 43140 TaxID=2819100 RepID=UPI00218A6776|nr:GNAT family protein [Vibrio sp. SCSIO 43140]USD62094.1 GNAT family N-acetyltransferase [Vibrio sp. SCSIO 43140]